MFITFIWSRGFLGMQLSEKEEELISAFATIKVHILMVQKSWNGS